LLYRYLWIPQLGPDLWDKLRDVQLGVRDLRIWRFQHWKHDWPLSIAMQP